MLWGVLLIAVPSAPAEVSNSAKEIETDEIIVNGERVKRSLKETQSSVAVFRKQDLESMAAPDRIQDVLAQVPNVLITGRRDTPVIRGQNSVGELIGLPAFLGGARPRTVMQIDGRTVTFNEFANSSEGLWDIDRVEVFRSPQTTTQGVNSIAGAVFIQTADPTYRFESRARAIGGELKRRQLSAMASGPLVDDQLAFRVAGDLYRSRSANELSGPVEGVDLNDDRYGLVRAKLLAEPHALPGLRVLLTVSHVKSQLPQAVGTRAPYHERRDDDYEAGYFKARVDSATALISYRITPPLEWRTTFAWGDTRFRRLAPQGLGQTHINGRDQSFESILEWKPYGPVSMVGGISFQAMDLDQSIDLTATPLGTGSFKDHQPSKGIFGEMTWHPAQRLWLTGGLRYQSDRKRRTGLLTTDPELPIDYDKADHALLPKVSAAYDVSDDVRVGALVERAYNPGGVTLDPVIAQQVRFEPEYLWDYEAFVRADLLGGALSLNANLFYNDMRNAQRTLNFCIPIPQGCAEISDVANAPRGHSYGAELEADYRIAEGLRVHSGLGILRTRLTKTIKLDDPIAGKEFAASPGWTAAGSIEWEPVARLRLSSQVAHASGFHDDNAETSTERIKPWTTVDARISWRMRRFTAFAFARNLFDQFRVTFWGGPHDDPTLEVGTNEPREVGAGVDARF